MTIVRAARLGRRAENRNVQASHPSRIIPLVTIGLDADVGHHSVRYILPIAFSQRGSQSTHTHAAAMCGYCGASARIKFDDEQFAALFNELQARGDREKLMQLFGASLLCTQSVLQFH